jgi:hypothetical protein
MMKWHSDGLNKFSDLYFDLMEAGNVDCVSLPPIDIGSVITEGALGEGKTTLAVTFYGYKNMDVVEKCIRLLPQILRSAREMASDISGYEEIKSIEESLYETVMENIRLREQVEKLVEKLEATGIGR